MKRGGSNYPWWWASHIRTRQSNWLEQNLHDMEEKVQSTLKLIEQEGDSFAKRAEMYYRKRPELINFVEEFYRGYRALAERYDHISGELHSANNTIATVFPDKVKIPIDEDDLKVPSKIDPSKFYKGLTEKPQTKSLNNDAANPKSPKKVVERTGSPIVDEKMLEEMEKIQKNILVLQAEKEIIKSSYEAGLAKYWEIEKRIMELQGNACCLDEGIDLDLSVNEEDAEALMVTTALKSCGETLAKLHEQQQISEEEARIESNRIEDAEEKLRTLKGEVLHCQTGNQKLTDKSTVAGSSINNLEEEVCNMKQERLELQEICRKIQDQFQLDSDKSHNVPELGEKIDELVQKVSSLETSVLSQTAHIMRLRSETDELQKHLQGLENEKSTLIDNSGNSTKKIRDLEDELQELQALNSSIKDHKNQLQNNLSTVCRSLDVLAENLLASEKQEEMAAVCSSQVGILLDIEPDKQITDPRESDHREGHEVNIDPEASSLNFESQNISTDPNSSNQPEERGLDFGLQEKNTVPEVRVLDFGLQQKNTGSIETISSFDSGKENTDLEGSVPSSRSPKRSKDAEESDQSEGSVVNLELQNKSIDSRDSILPFEFQNTSPELEERTLNVELQKPNPDPEESVSDAGSQKQNREPEDLERLHLLLLDQLEDREKILLSEYTTILRNFKETKRKLSDLEKQNQETYRATVAQIRDLKSSNAMKDEEIQSLRQKVTFLQSNPDEKPSQFIESNDSGLDQIMDGSKSLSQTDAYQLDSEVISKLPVFDSFKDWNLELTGRTDESNAGTIMSASPNEEEIKVVLVDEEDTVLTFEEKFRRDIDELLEENLEFWLRFSDSFHQIQKFQTTLQELQVEFLKLQTENKKQEVSGSVKSEKPEASPIHKNLIELQSELLIWLEQNALLKEELQYRFSSLCSIQEEMSTVLKLASENGEVEFTAYQAGKFQGEVLSMQQENNKVEDELQAGLDHVKGLQSEVEKTLQKLHENFEISESKHHHSHHGLRHGSSRTRIPLRSFIFGTKPKKPSIFSCMNPALQKQYSDLRAGIHM